MERDLTAWCIEREIRRRTQNVEAVLGPWVAAVRTLAVRAEGMCRLGRRLVLSARIDREQGRGRGVTAPEEGEREHKTTHGRSVAGRRARQGDAARRRCARPDSPRDGHELRLRGPVRHEIAPPVYPPKAKDEPVEARGVDRGVSRRFARRACRGSIARQRTQDGAFRRPGRLHVPDAPRGRQRQARSVPPMRDGPRGEGHATRASRGWTRVPLSVAGPRPNLDASPEAARHAPLRHPGGSVDSYARASGRSRW